MNVCQRYTREGCCFRVAGRFHTQNVEAQLYRITALSAWLTPMAMGRPCRIHQAAGLTSQCCGHAPLNKFRHSRMFQFVAAADVPAFCRELMRQWIVMCGRCDMVSGSNTLQCNISFIGGAVMVSACAGGECGSGASWALHVLRCSNQTPPVRQLLQWVTIDGFITCTCREWMRQWIP